MVGWAFGALPTRRPNSGRDAPALGTGVLGHALEVFSGPASLGVWGRPFPLPESSLVRLDRPQEFDQE